MANGIKRLLNFQRELDTNRSAGLHSKIVALVTCHWGLVELACCRSDLFNASLIYVLQE